MMPSPQAHTGLNIAPVVANMRCWLLLPLAYLLVSVLPLPLLLLLLLLLVTLLS